MKKFLILLITVSIVIISIGPTTISSDVKASVPPPPRTAIFFDEETGLVSFDAYPLTYGEDLEGIYYVLNGGTQEKYSGPFQIHEGNHFIEYWCVIFDNYGNQIEGFHETSELIYDLSPPIVNIINPIEWSLYIFGVRLYVIGSGPCLCIGPITVEVEADDADGVGVKEVHFNYDDDSGFDNDGSDGWTDSYSNTHFGDLTISVTAIDKKGYESEPVEITIKMYNLGIFN